MEAKLIKHGHSYALLKDGKMVAFAHPEDFSNDHTIGKLSLKNCQAIERGYDLDELAKETIKIYVNEREKQTAYLEFINGFQKALEILGDKKFSEEDMMQLVKSSFYAGLSKGQGKNKDFNIDDYVKEHLQQTEWEVMIEMECCGNYSSCNWNCEHSPKTKLDAENCLILKRK